MRYDFSIAQHTSWIAKRLGTYRHYTAMMRGLPLIRVTEREPEESAKLKQIEEPARTTLVMAETDVLVIGGGPGGLSAALAAAREGVSTMLVERYGCYGGIIAQAMIGTVAWYRTKAETVDAGGIGVEFERRAASIGASRRLFFHEILDTEVFKHIADKMVQEAGVTPLLHCPAVDVIMEGSAIRGVITESKSGRQAILAKRVIDATGDADIAFHAGVPYRQDPKDRLEPATVNFGCSGVDTQRFIEYTLRNVRSVAEWGDASGEKEKEEFSTHLVEPFQKAKAAGEIPEDARIESYWGNFTDAGEIPTLDACICRGRSRTWDLTKRKRRRQQACGPP
jgi:hypothetical protein